MVYTLPIVAVNLLWASLAFAAPANYTDIESLDIELVAKAINARGVNYRGGQLPSCSGDNDPSYADAQTKFKDGEGEYITWDCNKKSAGNGGKQECWTEYFLTSYKPQYEGWEIAGSAIDCGSTSSCSNVEAKLTQKCKSNGWYAGGAVTTKVEDKFTKWVTGGVSIDAEVNAGGNGEKTFCVTEHNAATCTWSDKKCHTIWKSSRRVQVFGYMRRRCKYHTENTQIKKDDQKYDNSGSGTGAYTVGISGFDFDIPDQVPTIGCNALCGDINYPDQIPSEEAAIKIT